jgi:aspartyl-tRNA(Asn)/glutamyl-tRNA(Gln) amidotransferase subunit B
MKGYKATIGLEIHAELKTSSKMFCSCRNNPDEEKPNANVCFICMGHPGTLPVLNKQAIKHVIRIGRAVNGNIADFTEWDRKNYFYPDIPKGYQISQYKYPLVSGGGISGIDLTRIHLEEDTAQSTHDIHEKRLVNLNRSGVPLMELVTEPVIHDAETAVKFAKELQLLLRYLNAGEANLEKGEMRVEANISVSKTEKFGTKTEVKNLNSFKAVEKAIAYEIERQINALENGEDVLQETRGWDENTGKTYSQRLKESSHDYRYFPEPDLPKLKISEIPEFSKENIETTLPELPWDKRNRFVKDYMMTEKEVAVFIESPEIAEYFEQVIKDNKKIVKLSINYILSDYLGLIKKESKNINTVSAKNFSKLMIMIDEKKLSSRGAKDTLLIMLNDQSDPQMIAEKNGFIQKNDEGEIIKIVTDIVNKNPSVVSDYKNGKEVALQFLVGQGMKLTKGSANPEILKQLLLKVINQ